MWKRLFFQFPLLGSNMDSFNCHLCVSNFQENEKCAGAS